jgi:hypothetical protein
MATATEDREREQGQREEKKPASRIQFNTPGEGRSMTVAAWGPVHAVNVHAVGE